jgi:acrylyl-CoA reductase (NADPH)
MVGGIDLTGTVISDASGKFKEGDEIVVNSFGIGTDHFGGYAEEAMVRPGLDFKIKAKKIEN